MRRLTSASRESFAWNPRGGNMRSPHQAVGPHCPIPAGGDAVVAAISGNGDANNGLYIQPSQMRLNCMRGMSCPWSSAAVRLSDSRVIETICATVLSS